MAGYDDTKRLLIEALMGRPSETEIQPEKHQEYALSMLEYIHSIELISGSSVIGIANENTVPVQPDNSRVSYIAGIAQNRTMVFQNFIGQNGEALSVTTGDMECFLIILLWNTEYWSLQAIPSNIISQAENAVFYYRYNIRKTYNSIASMNADSVKPIGTDGKPINIGDIVTVVNSGNSSENAIYSRTEEGWQFQSGMNFALVQEKGDNPNVAMSQAAVTKEFSELDKILDKFDNKIFPLSVVVSGGGVFEKGTTQTITVKWVVKKGEEIATADTTLLNDVSVEGTNRVFSSVQTTTTYMVKVTKGSGKAQASTTATFVNASYFGAVASGFVANEGGIKALAKNVKNGRGYTGITNLVNQKICYAYPKSFGALVSIKDANNFEYLSSYVRSEVTVNGEPYYVYILKDAASIANFRQIYT